MDDSQLVLTALPKGRIPVLKMTEWELLPYTRKMLHVNITLIFIIIGTAGQCDKPMGTGGWICTCTEHANEYLSS